MNKRHIPILSIDIEGFTKNTREEQQTISRRLQTILTEQARFFMPYGDPWAKWKRHGTGDGYYILLDELPFRIALKYARNIDEALVEYNSKHGFDLPIRMRMVLLVGDVETEGDQYLSEAMAEAERFLSHPPFKSYLQTLAEQPTVLAINSLFHVELIEELGKTEDFPELHELQWTPVQFADKHEKPHKGYVLGAGWESRQAPAKGKCKKEMTSDFTKVMKISDENQWPASCPPKGEPLLTRISASRSGQCYFDFISDSQTGRVRYVEHDPFIGRTDMLKQMLRIPSSFGDGDEQQVIWVHGGPGMGKSALLRKAATTAADQVFFDKGEYPLYVLQVNCWNYTTPAGIRNGLLEKGNRLYSKDSPAEDIDELFRKIKSRQGRHLWFFDDLSYLDYKPDSIDNAREFITLLHDDAKRYAVPMTLIASARHAGPAHWTSIHVKSLTPHEARELAEIIWRRAQADPIKEMPANELTGALSLFRAASEMTGYYKRALRLSVDARKSFAEYAQALEKAGTLTAKDFEEFAKSAISVELKTLTTLEKEHGFRYSEFLGLYFEMIQRTGWFTLDELRTWFQGTFHHPAATVDLDTAFQNGIEYLAKLGFVSLENHSPSGTRCLLPPNMRVIIQALKNPNTALPKGLPPRGPKIRLSAALETLGKDPLKAILLFAEIEHDYHDKLTEPEYAEAVFQAMLIRAELVYYAKQYDQSITVYDEMVKTYEKLSESVIACSQEVTVQVAMALYNKGVALAELGQAETAIAAYDEVVSRYGDRPEAAIADWAAKALVNKGVVQGKMDKIVKAIETFDKVVACYGNRPESALAEQAAMALFSEGYALDKLGRAEEAIKAYDEVIARYGERSEAALAEKVAKALVNKGVALGGLGQAEQAIAAYDEVVSRYGKRPEAALAEQTATALVNKGITLHGLGQAEAAIAAYDEVVSSYGKLPEAALAVQVAMALFNKGVALGELGQAEQAIAAYDEVVSRYGERPEAALAEQTAMALVNKGITLHGLGQVETAIAAYDEIVSRYSKRPEAALAEQAAKALFSKGYALGKLGRAEEGIKVYDEVVSRYGKRPEVALAEQVAMALVNKGNALVKLGRAKEAITAYDEVVSRYSDRPEVALAEKVAIALVNKGNVLVKLGRAKEAIKAFDEVIARYGERPEAALAEQAATAMVNKGITLHGLGQAEQAIAAYDEVVSRYGKRPEAALAEQTATALVNKGNDLGNLGQAKEAIKVYDEVIARYGERTEAALAEQAAKALVNKGVALDGLGRIEEKIAAYNEVVSRYGERPEAALAEKVAKAMVNKVVALGNLGQAETAIAAYDEVVSRYGERTDVALAEQAAKALVNKGVALGNLGQAEQEIAAYDEVVSRYGERTDVALAEQAANALVNKGVALGRLGQAEQAIAAYDEVVSRYGERTEAALAENVATALNQISWAIYAAKDWKNIATAVEKARAANEKRPNDANLIHTYASVLGVSGKWPEAFQLAEKFLEDNGHVIKYSQDIIGFFRDAAAAGEAKKAREVLEKSSAAAEFKELRTALRQLAGETGLEIDEKARELLEQIEARRKELPSPAS